MRKLWQLFLFLLTISSQTVFGLINPAYVCNFTSDTVSVIDTTTNTVVATIPVSHPNQVAITPNGQFAYISQALDNQISIVDTATNTVIDTIAVTSPEQLAFTPDGQKLYVTSFNAGHMTVIDTNTNTISTVINVNGPENLTITPNGKYVYVTGFNPFGVSVIDATTNTVVQFIPLTTPRGIAVTPDGTSVYVTNTSNNTIYIIDTATNTLSPTTIVVPNTPGYIAIMPNGKQAYVAGTFAPFIFIIDISTNTLNNSVLLVNVSQLAFTPDSAFAYITEPNQNQVGVMSTATQTIVTNIPVGVGPGGIAISGQVPGPLNLTGRQQVGADSGLQREFVNIINWTSNPGALNIAGYFVYRNGTKIATLSPTTLQYQDHDRKKGASTLYSVTSFFSSGAESLPASVIVQ